jgi:hypothetical protein
MTSRAYRIDRETSGIDFDAALQAYFEIWQPRARVAQQSGADR